MSEHLGGFDWFARLPNHATMTVGDLLRHGAGLPDHVHLEAFQAEMAERMSTGAAALTPEEAIAFILEVEPLFHAGADWAHPGTACVHNEPLVTAADFGPLAWSLAIKKGSPYKCLGSSLMELNGLNADVAKQGIRHKLQVFLPIQQP